MHIFFSTLETFYVVHVYLRILHLQDDYICDLSQFKLDTCVAKEMSSFLSGFWKVLLYCRCLIVNH